MANAQNIKPAKSFQDDLDAIFDGLSLEDYSENLKDDSDDFDRLLTEKITGQSAAKKELTDADIDKLLMVPDKPRAAPKLVALDKKAGNSRNLDVLLDDAASLDDNKHFDFKSFDFDESSDDFSHADDSAETVDKSAEVLKKVVFDQFDDFESFDEFGDIDADTASKAFDINSVPKPNKSGKPESMVDLQGSFGGKSPAAVKKMDVASGEEILTGAKSSATLSTPEKHSPVATVTTQAIAPEKSVVSLDYEMLEDDFVEVPQSQSNLELKADEDVRELVTENDGADFEFFESPAFEGSRQDGFGLPDDRTADMVSKSDNTVPVVECKAVDSFADDHTDAAALFMRREAVDVAVAPKVTDTSHPALEQQVSELWAAHQLVKERVDDLTQNKEQDEQPNKMEELDRQSKERRERKQLQELFENKSKKISRIAYMAAGAGVLSLLIGGAALTLGVGSRSDVNALKLHAADIDNDIAGIKAGKAPAVGSVGSSGDSSTVLQLAEQVKKIQAVLTGDKAVAIRGVDTSAAGTLQDIQYKGDKSIRIVAASADSKASGGKALWVANLLSVRQNTYAQQKAADFAKQGIPTVVVPVEVNGQTIYILRSNGFSTQDQALAYATKAKKALNLSSILVSQDG